eukprot:EG_transcript_2867
MAPPRKAYTLGPFWLGYAFQAGEEELQFRERARQMMRPAINVWCGYQAVLAVCLALREVATGDLPAALLPLCPIALSSATLFFFNFDWASKHVRYSAELVLAAMCMLLSAYVSTKLFLKAGHNSTTALEHQLVDVVRELSLAGRPQLVEVLNTYVHQKDFEAAMASALGYVIVQLALLAHLGFTWTVASGIFMSAMIVFIVFLSNSYISPGDVFVQLLLPGLVVVAYYLYLSLCIAMLRRRQFAVEQTFETDFNDAVAAAQEADTILNHTLKNTMADASGEIEIFLSQTEQQDSHLVRSMECLRRGMRSCQHRQAYLELSAKKYHPLFTAVQLDEFAKELTAGRQMKVETNPAVVMVDRVLCSLILDNAISNSFKHGHPDHPAVQFDTAVSALPPDMHLPGSVNGVSVTFTITNRANPSLPLITPTFLSHILQGKPPRQDDGLSMLSSRVGLQHSALAAQAHGIKWHLSQSGDLVTFKATMSAKLAPKPADEHPLYNNAADSEALLQGLTVFCIDDSACARRLLAYHLGRHLPTARVCCFGESSGDVTPFVEGILAGVDIAILDEHLDFQNGAMVLGSDLVRQCRAARCTGVMCIRSANVSPAEVSRYRAAGADLVVGKDVPVPKLIEQLKAEVVRRCALSAATAPRSNPFSLPGVPTASPPDLALAPSPLGNHLPLPLVPP